MDFDTGGDRIHSSAGEDGMQSSIGIGEVIVVMAVAAVEVEYCNESSAAGEVGVKEAGGSARGWDAAMVDSTIVDSGAAAGSVLTPVVDSGAAVSQHELPIATKAPGAMFNDASLLGDAMDCDAFAIFALVSCSDIRGNEVFLLGVKRDFIAFFTDFIRGVLDRLLGVFGAQEGVEQSDEIELELLMDVRDREEGRDKEKFGEAFSSKIITKYVFI